MKGVLSVLITTLLVLPSFAGQKEDAGEQEYKKAEKKILEDPDYFIRKSGTIYVDKKIAKHLAYYCFDMTGLDRVLKAYDDMVKINYYSSKAGMRIRYVGRNGNFLIFKCRHPEYFRENADKSLWGWLYFVIPADKVMFLLEQVLLIYKYGE